MSMMLDKQSAKELAEAILWWEGLCVGVWNATLGNVLGKVEVEEPEEAPLLHLAKKDPE